MILFSSASLFKERGSCINIGQGWQQQLSGPVIMPPTDAVSKMEENRKEKPAQLEMLETVCA